MKVTGRCADKRVVCTLIDPATKKVVAVGTNDVATPQKVCPRVKGENYLKCQMVCGQPGHAEQEAVRAAGDKSFGTWAYIEGISWVCDDCWSAMARAGVTAVTLGPPPK